MPDLGATPNLISVAVHAAGGQQKVADRFGLSRAAVSTWVVRGTVSADSDDEFRRRVHELCAMGANVIAPMTLFDYIAERAAVKARERVLARAA